MKPLIDAGQVHLWWAFLDVSDEWFRALAALLSEEETARAGRFVSDLHKRYYTASRGMLRLLLGDYLAIPPGAVEIARNQKGKPYLKGAGREASLCFNLSHSRGAAMFGFCADRRIGVDVERVDPARNPEKLARRFFRPKEVQEMMAAPDSSRHEWFFRYWTMKEAYLKATGDGIGRLGDIEVVAETRGGWRVRDAATGCGKNWTVSPVSVQSGYAGAVAFDGIRPARISVYHVDERNITNL